MTTALSDDVRVAVKEVRARKARRIQRAKQGVAILAILSIFASVLAFLVSRSSLENPPPTFGEVFVSVWWFYGALSGVALLVLVIFSIVWWAWPTTRPPQFYR